MVLDYINKYTIEIGCSPAIKIKSSKKEAMEGESKKLLFAGLHLQLSSNFMLILLLLLIPTAIAWTGEIRGRVVCDVCGDSSLGPEDHILEGAEVAVLCITKSGEVVNYQAFTDSKGVYTVAETMPESERWDACLARPISSFHERCNRLRDGSSGVKFTYKRLSGRSYNLKPFVYQFANAPTYCM